MIFFWYFGPWRALGPEVGSRDLPMCINMGRPHRPSQQDADPNPQGMALPGPLPAPAALTRFSGLACRPPSAPCPARSPVAAGPPSSPLWGLCSDLTVGRWRAPRCRLPGARHHHEVRQAPFSACLSPSTSWPWGLGLPTSPRCLESHSACGAPAGLPLCGYVVLLGGAREASGQDTLEPSVGQLPCRGLGDPGIWWPSRPSPHRVPHSAQWALPQPNPGFPTCLGPAGAPVSGVTLASVWAERTVLEEVLHSLRQVCLIL